MSTDVMHSATPAQASTQLETRSGRWPALVGGALFAAIPLVWWPLCDLLTAGMPEVNPPTREMLRLHALRHALEFPAPALLAFGLLAVYRQYRGPLGAVGQAGLAMLVFGLVARALLAGGIVLTEGVIGTQVDALELVHVSPVVAMLGSVAFGFAALRSDALPRRGSLLVLVPALALFAQLALLGFASGLAWIVTEALMALNGLGFAVIGFWFWRQR